MKVASGGELSRFLLALKVVLADRGSAPVLIFDEIDTGVGGAVADAIGRRLARLADKVQVLSVTHAPQVAARARQHLLIEKQAVEEGAFMRTHVQPLSGDGAQRGSGAHARRRPITDEARAAAGTAAVRGPVMAASPRPVEGLDASRGRAPNSTGCTTSSPPPTAPISRPTRRRSPMPTTTR